MPILPATDHDDSQERSRRQILYYSRIGPGQRPERTGERQLGPGGGQLDTSRRVAANAAYGYGRAEY